MLCLSVLRMGVGHARVNTEGWGSGPKYWCCAGGENENCSQRKPFGMFCGDRERELSLDVAARITLINLIRSPHDKECQTACSFNEAQMASSKSTVQDSWRAGTRQVPVHASPTLLWLKAGDRDTPGVCSCCATFGELSRGQKAWAERGWSDGRGLAGRPVRGCHWRKKSRTRPNRETKAEEIDPWRIWDGRPISCAAIH